MILKNYLEPCGVIFPKYEPVAAHGDPFQAGFYKKQTLFCHYAARNHTLKPDFSFFGGHSEGVRPI